jgi:chorismate lyase / 3-hydroxybenzoate synthase
VNRIIQGAASPVTKVIGPQKDADPKISNPTPTTAPLWATEMARGTEFSSAPELETRRSDHFTLLTLRVPGADVAEGKSLEDLIESAYRELLLGLRSGPHPYPLRVWNFIPGILEDGGDGLNRYMRFNAGRHRAYGSLLGGAETFDRSLPAASAVGHPGSEVVIHALAAATPGSAIANPRQCSPHRYSRQYGPLPPCFARATRVDAGTDTPLLLIGGTASIRGEDSLHVSDLENQLHETRTNLIALLGAASGSSTSPDLLNQLDQLRVYFPGIGNLARIRAAVEEWFPHPDRVEWRHAELCRGELLVEIEGRAVLQQPL